MPEWDEPTTDYDDELDDEFLSRYSHRKRAAWDGSYFRPDDDGEDDEEIFSTAAVPTTRPLLETTIPTQTDSSHECLEAVSTNCPRSDDDAGGAKPSRRSALEFQRRTRTGTGEFRKKLVYYASRELMAELSAMLPKLGLRRREFCVLALSRLLDDGIPLSDVNSDGSQTRIFRFDEIPSSLWDRLDQYARGNDEGSSRRVPLWKIVDIALRREIARQS